MLVLSKAREGKLHDKRFEAEEEIAFHIPDEIPIEVDLGFQGLQFEFTNIRIPPKKPRGGELSEEQKQENRTLSQSRVVCEKRSQASSATERSVQFIAVTFGF